MPVPFHIWSLTKDGRVLRCELRGHPIGRELVLLEDGELRRSWLVRRQADLLRVYTEWREAAELKGWRETPPDDSVQR